MYNPWYQRNQQAITINPHSPQANGLVAWFPMLASPNQKVLREFVQHFNGTLNGNLTGFADSTFGIGIDFPNDSGAYVNAPAPDSLFLGALSIVVWANCNTGGTYRHFAGKHAGGGGTNNPFDYRTTNENPPKLYLLRANTATRRHTGQDVILNEIHMYSVVCPSSQIEDPVTFYVDNVATTGTQTHEGTGAPTGTGADIRIGVRADSAIRWDGQMYDVKIYNRGLTSADIEHLYDPITRWDIYQPPKRYYAIAPAAASSIPVFMHHYQQQRQSQ